MKNNRDKLEANLKNAVKKYPEVQIDCSKCPDPGSCCGTFSFKKEFLEKHQHKFQIEILAYREKQNGIELITSDRRCIFMNRKTKKCVIYEDRPALCKLYGTNHNILIQCPYFKPNGMPRSTGKTKQIMKACGKKSKENARKENEN